MTDVCSGYVNVCSTFDQPMRMLNRLSAFDAGRFGGLIQPGGWIAECDYRDIMAEYFSDVTTPVFFGNNYARQAGYSSKQKFLQALSACGSQWFIPQAELVAGYKNPVFYMEANSAYAEGGPLYPRAITGGSALIRDVTVSSETHFTR
jgi:hypothetical protein